MTAASSIKTPIMTLPLKQGLGMPQAAELTTRLRHICLAEVDCRACNGATGALPRWHCSTACCFCRLPLSPCSQIPAHSSGGFAVPTHSMACSSHTQHGLHEATSSPQLFWLPRPQHQGPCPPRPTTQGQPCCHKALSAAQTGNPHVPLQVLEGVTLSEQPWAPSSATSVGFARVYKVMLHFQDPSKYPQEVGLDWQAVKLAFSRSFIGALTVSRKLGSARWVHGAANQLLSVQQPEYSIGSSCRA